MIQPAWTTALLEAADSFRAFGSAARSVGVELARFLLSYRRNNAAEIRRIIHPRHAYTGSRHRGTRKWNRRYAHR